MNLLGFNRMIAAAVYHQEQVLKVMTLLSGKYRYAQVEAAINAAGVSPHDLYMCLAANEPTFTLLRFYEALGQEVKHR